MVNSVEYIAFLVRFITDTTRDLLTQLEDENVITRRHGKIYVRASDPPHSSLSGPF